MDLKWLVTFVTVYEEGSFRAAAEKLYISQPSITVHIKALEEALQVPLFKREHTKVTLTENGKLYYPLAKKMLLQVDIDRKFIQNIAKKSTIHLVISLSPSLTSSTILKLISRFQLEHPNYEIEIKMQKSTLIDLDLNSHMIDIAFTLNRTKSKRLHSERIMSEPLQLVCSSQLVNPDVSLHENLSNLLLNYPLYTGYLDEHTPIVEYLEKEYSFQKVNVVKDSIFAIRIVKEQIGIGLVPLFLIPDEIKSKQLLALDIGQITSIYKINMYMCYERNNASIQPFLQYIREFIHDSSMQ